MANPEHLAKIREGVQAWNLWRTRNPYVQPDLRDANLTEFDLDGVDFSKTSLWAAILSGAYLKGADLTQAYMHRVDLQDADLSGANLAEAQLSDGWLRGARLRQADLRKADVRNADLTETVLAGANLSGANLSGATLVDTNLEGANLTGCFVYGISTWNVRLRDAIQSNLVITPFGQHPIQVDNLEVAQFIYLLLNNDKIRGVIDTITSKVVLILGRFKPERKVVLDAIRDELRKHDYLPVLFDFEKPASRDLTGTISTLANMARFIVADLTDPSSVPHELASIVPATVVPVQAIIQEGQQEYAMFPDFRRRYHWVLEPLQYTSQEMLIAQIGNGVISPAEAKARELART